MVSKIKRLGWLIKLVFNYINTGYIYIPLDKGGVIYEDGSLFISAYNIFLNTEGYLAHNSDAVFMRKLIKLQKNNDKEGIKQLLLEEANKASKEIEKLAYETRRVSR